MENTYQIQLNTRYQALKIACFISVGLIAAFLLSNCTQTLATDTTEGKEDKTPVEVAEVVTEEISIPVRISGNISASKESRLSFKTGGIIKEIRVNEGDEVIKGELLASLDLKEINQQVLQAEIALEKAQRDYNRINNLYRDTVATLEQLQNAKSALEVAEATLNITLYNQQYSTIYAPSDGIILQKYMEENEITGTGTPVFYFASLDKNWRMVVGVTDKNIVKLALDDPATIVTDAYPDQSLKADVSKIANAPEMSTGLYEVELVVRANDLKLKPGFFARGEIIPANMVACSKLPVDAVHEGIGRKVSFFIYDNMKAVQVESDVVFLQDEFVYVDNSNLANTFKVITRMPAELKHMDPVLEVIPSINLQALNTHN